MVKRDVTLTPDTLIPIGTLGVVAAVIIWLTTLANQTQANTTEIREIRVKQDAYTQSIQAIEKSQVRMEEQLKMLREGK